MLVSLQLLVLVGIFFSVLYWVLPLENGRLKQCYLLVTSCFLIFIYSPLVLFILVLFSLFAVVLFRFIRYMKNASGLVWLVFLPLVAVNFIEPIDFSEKILGSPRSAASVNWLYLGMSYYTIKTFISLKQAVKLGRLDFVEMSLANTFFPAFVSGPIDGADKFRGGVFTRAFNLREFALGYARVGIGLFKLVVVLPQVNEVLGPMVLGDLWGAKDPDWEDFSVLNVLSFIWLSFLILYVNFSGFTDIAVGIGKLFHLEISENFKFPLFANSIQNFWQRWHLSLSKFIGKYLYKPLVRRTGRPSLSIIVTFTLVGLWHNISLGYLIWGFCHGALLAIQMRYGRKSDAGSATWLRAPKYVISSIVTLTVVATLSSLANLDSSSEIIAFTRALLGIRGLHD